jgi:hypothetical protein
VDRNSDPFKKLRRQRRQPFLRLRANDLKAFQQIILKAIDIADDEGRLLGTVTTVKALEPLLPVGLAFQKVASEAIKYSSVER